MKIKILPCLTSLLLAFGLLTTHANSDSPLDQQTLDQLRDTYDLEAPPAQVTPPNMMERLKQGDWGISLNPSSLNDLIHATQHPVFYLTRQLVYILSS